MGTPGRRELEGCTSEPTDDSIDTAGAPYPDPGRYPWTGESARSGVLWPPRAARAATRWPSLEGWVEVSAECMRRPD